MSTDYDGMRRQFLELLGQLGDPAFVRRAQRVQEAHNGLIRRCQQERQERLKLARLRLGIVAARIGSKWETLTAFLHDESRPSYLASLCEQWNPVLQLPVDATRSERKIRRALGELAESFARFNRQWEPYLQRVDLTRVNKVRDDYNRYYVIEKACAFQSEQMGQDGFKEMPPYTIDDLISELPGLRVPELI